MFGISGRRQRASAPSDAHDLADVVLHDSAGDDVRLGDMWAERPAVLVFLRHYG